MKTPAHHIGTLCCWILAKYRIIHGTRKALDHISQTYRYFMMEAAAASRS